VSGLVALWLALVPGEVVWSALAAAVAGLAVVTSRARTLVGPVAVFRWLLGSWAGRVIALAAWAGAGWHLFCQRP
jgi:hypothetical protein